MNNQLVNNIVRATLYEGYILYPYRPSAVKNRQRFNFGVLYPPACAASGPSQMQTECLWQGDEQTTLSISVRFLHLVSRETRGADEAWQEAVEREVCADSLRLGELRSAPQQVAFTFPAQTTSDQTEVRRQQALAGTIHLAVAQLSERTCRLTARVMNETPSGEADSAGRDEALLHSFVSTHTILNVNGGEFVSLLDPPEALGESARLCRNVGTWPVLVGADGERDTMLSSPIILYDYPEVAPESPGDFFDGTEIDEMLTLRILTLTDAEKAEMRAADERARQLLERTESLPAEHLAKLHGAVRGLRRVAGESS